MKSEKEKKKLYLDRRTNSCGAGAGVNIRVLKSRAELEGKSSDARKTEILKQGGIYGMNSSDCH